MLNLLFARHGETDSNVKGTYLGWKDVVLNENGIKQAYVLKDKLSCIKLDEICSSPLLRTKRTAEIINEAHGIEIKYCDDLKETNFGWWEDLLYKEIINKYPEEYNHWINDVNYTIPGGESTMDAYNRAAAFIDGLINRKSSGTVLIITHLGSIRNILACLLGLGIEGAWRFRVDNCSVVKVVVNDEKYAYISL